MHCQKKFPQNNGISGKFSSRISVLELNEFSVRKKYNSVFLNGNSVQTTNYYGNFTEIPSKNTDFIKICIF